MIKLSKIILIFVKEKINYLKIQRIIKIMSYKKDEVFRATLEYFKGDTLATNVWIDKYCLKNNGEYFELTPDDMHRRLAKEFARIEKKYINPMSEEEIFNLLKDFKYIIPQGSPMAGIGNNFVTTSISNCFVVGNGNIKDSYGAIMRTDEHLVQLSKRRAGVGTDLSYIRPVGSNVGGTKLGDNSGIGLYMERYSNSIREVQQDGRRGALLLSISVLHPDSEKFIDKKMVEGSVTGANVSVKITDEFIKKTLNDEDFIQRYPIDLDINEINAEELKYDKLVEVEGGYVKKIKAKKIWDKIIYNAWKSAEPGCLFWDRALNESPARGYGDKWRETSTNPCFPASELLLTNKGFKSFGDLYKLDENIEVVCDNRISFNHESDGDSSNPNNFIFDLNNKYHTVRLASNVFLTRKNTEIIRITTNSGYSLKCTPDHHIATTIGMVQAKDLTVEHEILINDLDSTQNKTDLFKRSVECENEDVYCINEPIGHNIIVNGICTRQCGEIVLNDMDSCRLTALNLKSYVKNKFLNDSFFDVDLFKEHVIKAQRLMDDIVDLELEKIDKILEKVKSGDEPEEFKTTEINLWEKIKQNAIDGRRTGLGITAEGDMLASLGLKYGTTEATQYARNIHKLFAESTYESSIILAKERGCFPDWDLEKDKESNFIQRLFYSTLSDIKPELIEQYKITGRRNIACNTIAPTGSLSILTQTTSGIEPLFAPWYFRRRKTEDKNKSIITDEVGDMWEEYPVFHKPFMEWFQVESDTDNYEDVEIILKNKPQEELNRIFEKSPYFQATAQDVDYLEKVRMQGEIQCFIDHSISVTTNCPSTTTVETIGEIYKTAWESGCKGVTVYRDGSRGGILNTKKTVAEAEKFEYIHAIKRPKSVKHEVFIKTALKQEYIIFVGIIDNKPYEIFALPYKDIFSQLKNTKFGTITKIKSGIYRFTSENGFIIDNIIEHMLETEQNQTRDYSTMLRHRIDPKFIIDQIKSYATISSFQKVIGRILEKYVEYSENDNKCPECGGKIIYSEGCLHCENCHYSRCG